MRNEPKTVSRPAPGFAATPSRVSMLSGMSDGPANLLYYGDNLDILRRYVGDESVDLVYLTSVRCRRWPFQRLWGLRISCPERPQSWIRLESAAWFRTPIA